ncbi:MAG: putative sulfate exporter family transporter [Proteobacteria bacterium]|nr:putative sulfate exporter family transporter [Pseudomonadota bacterium]
MLATLARAADPQNARLLFPGVVACAVAAAAAGFLGEHYGAPVLLFALLLGLAMNFLGEQGPCRPGIEFCAKTVLRIGVALLGLRITLAQAAALGWGPLLLVLICVAATIALSMVAARRLGFQSLFGLLTGGAVAICGASAALALAAALPAHPQKERATLFTVIGVSALSTFAMVAYPMVVKGLGLDARAAGIFLGATIHDVAQVVGAGYSLSTETGDAATLVKLLRVAMLLPVIVLAAALTRRRLAAEGAAGAGGQRPPLLPGFAVGFAVLVAINSTGIVPAALQTLGNETSRWCLVAAMAGIGMKTQLKELATVGFKPVALMIGETVFLAALALALMRWLG